MSFSLGGLLDPLDLTGSGGLGLKPTPSSPTAGLTNKSAGPASQTFNAAQGLSTQLINEWTSGKLSAGEQAQVDALTKANQAAVNDYVSKTGQSASTANLGLDENVNMQTEEATQAILNNDLAAGMQALGIQDTASAAIDNYALGQQTNLIGAFSGLGNAIGSLI